MSSPGAVAFFCLAGGAGLGALFLAGEALGKLPGLGKPGRAVADLLGCAVAGVTVFFWALAVDHGRVRLFQLALMALGAWAVWAALGPGGARRRRKNRRNRGNPEKKQKKT